jgi:TP53 regulating kinase-like protein
LKYRPSKLYRHPILDSRLTRARILAEARVLARCRRDGVPVPAVYAIDEAEGWLIMEWVEGGPVRKAINEWLGARPKNQAGAEANEGVAVLDPGRDYTPLIALMRRIGTAVGNMHRVGVIHGDLTTSNMMLKPRTEAKPDGLTQEAEILQGDIVLIDFGLATQSVSDEDRAVDLYVLERAFGSTHPRAESLFDELLQAYKDTFKQASSVIKKLEDVRMRGRKRSMLG